MGLHRGVHLHVAGALKPPTMRQASRCDASHLGSAEGTPRSHSTAEVASTSPQCQHLGSSRDRPPLLLPANHLFGGVWLRKGGAASDSGGGRRLRRSGTRSGCHLTTRAESPDGFWSQLSRRSIRVHVFDLDDNCRLSLLGTRPSGSRWASCKPCRSTTPTFRSRGVQGRRPRSGGAA
jgi:hypothetical protein